MIIFKKSPLSVHFMGFKDKIKAVYEGQYKLLMLIPILMVVLAIMQIGVQFAMTGEPVHRGISLKGGSAITISDPPAISSAELQDFLNQQFPRASITVRTIGGAGETIGIAIDSDAQQEEEINAILAALKQKLSLQENQFGVEIIGSSLGAGFFRQTLIALLTAFILMGIVVFLYFRVPIPSLAVVAAAFSDIVVTLAIFNLTGIKLSSAGVAAFLMLIGYSVDTDMLLTSRVLRRKEGTLMDRIYSSISTGMTMTVTTLSVLVVGLIFVQSDVIKQIMLILFIGLLVDMPMTWIQNVGILRLYFEKKGRKTP